jgi:hypothetical protein
VEISLETGHQISEAQTGALSLSPKFHKIRFCARIEVCIDETGHRFTGRSCGSNVTRQKPIKYLFVIQIQVRAAHPRHL